MIHEIIKVGNPTICETKHTYEVTIKVNDSFINRLARNIDKSFNNGNFYLEVSVDKGEAEFEVLYFYGSDRQRNYIIAGLTNEDWNYVKASVLFHYSKRR